MGDWLSVYLQWVRVALSWRNPVVKTVASHTRTPGNSISTTTTSSTLTSTEDLLFANPGTYSGWPQVNTSVQATDGPPTQTSRQAQTDNTPLVLGHAMRMQRLAGHSPTATFLPPTHEPLRCDVCHRGFRHPKSLNHHMRLRHMDNPAFRCDLCGAGFMKSADFIGHMNRHNNVQGFSCPHCPKKFTYKGDMYKHRKICQQTLPPDSPTGDEEEQGKARKSTWDDSIRCGQYCRVEFVLRETPSGEEGIRLWDCRELCDMQCPVVHSCIKDASSRRKIIFLS